MGAAGHDHARRCVQLGLVGPRARLETGAEVRERPPRRLLRAAARARLEVAARGTGFDDGRRQPEETRAGDEEVVERDEYGPRGRAEYGPRRSPAFSTK